MDIKNHIKTHEALGGYSGDLYDSTNTAIASVESGLITGVYFGITDTNYIVSDTGDYLVDDLGNNLIYA